MKLFKICAVSALATGSLSAQGIFDVSPNDGVTESLPLKVTGTINFGWDDNISPTLPVNRGEDATYTSANVGVNYLNQGPQTSVDFNLKLGVLYYFDTPGGSGVKDTYNDSRMIFNVSHRVSERLRFSTRNYVFYGLEPDYNFGAVNDRTNDEYLFFSTDNAVGYKWTDRFGTYTGVKYDALTYSNADSRNDRENITVYNQFRYIINQQSIATVDYRFRMANVKNGLDSDNHKILLGVEHRISPTSILIAKAGAQYRKVDGRDAQTDPTFELGYINRVNQQFKVRANIAYEINDYGTSFFGANFENNQVFRASVAGDYYLSQKLYFTGGVNYVMNDYYGGRPSDEVNVLNLSLGATYEIMDNLTANVNYNYTSSMDDGDTLGRDYSRNRIQSGLTFAF